VNNQWIQCFLGYFLGIQTKPGYKVESLISNRKTRL